MAPPTDKPKYSQRRAHRRPWSGASAQPVRSFLRLLVSVIVLGAGLGVTVAPPASEAAGGYDAATVIGQYDNDGAASYTQGFVQGQQNLDNPIATAYDPTSNSLFVTTYASSVLVFYVNPTTKAVDRQPYAILGQPDFNTTGDTTSSTTMSNPVGISIDVPGRRLFVSEYNNNRVLIFNISTVTNGMAASNVLGQSTMGASATGNGQAGLNRPFQTAYDTDTSLLYVTDSVNHRVMVWDLSGSVTNGMNATYVLGQPNFSTYSSGLTSQKMNTPQGISLNTNTNRLYVSEKFNNRVSIFNIASTSTNQTAINVLGQPNLTSNTGSTAQNRLNNPEQSTLDIGRNRLFVTDASDRVLVWNLATTTDGMNATYVLGQANFTSSGDQLNQNGFTSAIGMAFDEVNDRLYVADRSVHRVMVFDGNITASNPAAINLLGHVGDNGAPNYTNSSSTTNVTTWGMYQPTGVTIDSVNHRMFVSDRSNNRVLVYNLDSDDNLVDRFADYVLGQPNMNSTSSAATQSGLNIPRGLAFQPSTNRLFVADQVNNRIMVWDVSSLSNGKNAAYVLGQSTWTGSASGSTQATLFSPSGIALDPTGNRLYVGDIGNSRVMIWDISTLANGKNAANVLGQTNFTNTAGGSSNGKFSVPSTLAFDTSTSRLFVMEESNRRIQVFDLTSITDGETSTNVLGQPNYATTSTGLTNAKLGDTPYGLAIDVTGQRLFVSDFSNNRVLVFNVSGTLTNGVAATRVFGQADFTTATAETTRDSTYMPAGVFFHPTQKKIYVPQWGNHRISVFETDVTITTASLSNATNGNAYSQSITSTNSNGTKAYALSSGSLPPGLSMSTAGVITGTPSGASGTYNFTVQATLTSGIHSLTATKALSIAMTNQSPNAPTGLNQTKTDGTSIPGTTLYTFDTGEEGWYASGDPDNNFTYSTAQQRNGAGSLRFGMTGGRQDTWVTDGQWDDTRDMSAAGQTFSTWVYLPAGNTGTNWEAMIEVYDVDSNDHGGASTLLTAGQWNLISVTPEPDVVKAMRAIAVYVWAGDWNATGTNYVYIDDVQQGNGAWTNESSVRFTADVSDPDASDTLQLCVEVKPIGTAFNGTDTCNVGAAYSGTPLAAVNTIGGLANNTHYHWRARTRDAAGTTSAWVAYGSNKDTVTASTDFAVDTTAPVATWARDGAAYGVDANLNDGSLNSLSLNGEVSVDNQSGVARIEYSFGTTPGATDIRAWTWSSKNSPVTDQNLTLRTGQTYYGNVRLVDVAGNVSNVVSSNGQSVAPTLTFGTSANEITFDVMNSTNSFAPDPQPLTVTTSTNAYAGYVIHQYANSLLTSGSDTVANYSGTYASPSLWAGTGFGYTSNDTSIQSAGNKFAGASRFAAPSMVPPGDVVADHTATVSGAPISNEQFVLTYKVVSSGTQPAGRYSTTLVLGATATF